MISQPLDSDFPEQPHVDLLEDVRKLQITYSRLRPGAGTCFVEYVGGRIRVYEVDRFLIERLLEQLEHREARSSRANFLELRFGEVRSAPLLRSRGPILGGAIIRAGIIRALCMPGYKPSTLYIRQFAV